MKILFSLLFLVSCATSVDYNDTAKFKSTMNSTFLNHRAELSKCAGRYLKGNKAILLKFHMTLNNLGKANVYKVSGKDKAPKKLILCAVEKIENIDFPRNVRPKTKPIKIKQPFNFKRKQK